MVDIIRAAARYKSLLAARMAWEPAWKDLAEHFLPLRWRSQSDTETRPGRLNSRLMDSTGVLDMRTLAAGLHGGMTNPSRQWFSFVPADRESPASPEDMARVESYLSSAEAAVSAALRRSNFYNTVHALYSDLGTFGTALMLETADAEGLNFELACPGDYVLDTDGKGRPDIFFRRIALTARQLEQNFGGESLPDTVRSVLMKPESVTRRFIVIHGVFPREGGHSGSAAENLPFASVYWMEETADLRGKPAVLKESGFCEFPAFAPRWSVSTGDVYGRSPAMDVLPDCRMLQGMVTTLRKMQHKIADPPLAVDSALAANGVELMPGGLNFVQSGRDASSAIAAIQQPQPAALEHTMKGVEQVREVIHAGLYADLLKMMTDEYRSQVTAEEISARESERLILIGPVVERLENELLGPLIRRTVGIMQRAGALPMPPPELDGGRGLSVEIRFRPLLGPGRA